MAGFGKSSRDSEFQNPPLILDVSLTECDTGIQSFSSLNRNPKVTEAAEHSGKH